MTIYTIYTATNTTNQKVYVGFTTNFQNRVLRHKALYQNTPKKLYTAIRKYGWDKFIWEEIYVSKDKEHCLNTMEQFFIEQYDSIRTGYNTTEGGAGVLGVNKNTIWVNNGSAQKRVLPENIPTGWVRGKLKVVRKVKMSNETKAIIGSKNKEHGVFSKINSKKIPCPHCGFLMNIGNLTRHIRSKHS